MKSQYFFDIQNIQIENVVFVQITSRHHLQKYYNIFNIRLPNRKNIIIFLTVFKIKNIIIFSVGCVASAFALRGVGRGAGGS